MRFYIFLAALLASLLTGCFGGSTTNTNNAASGNKSSQSANEYSANDAKPANNAIKMEEIYPVASYSQATPTDAMKTYIMATVNKDVAAIEGILSKASIEMIEESAKMQDKTIGEILTAGAVENKSKSMPAFRKEKISGETATVEYKDETMNEFLAMPLVREDGKWKIALDVFGEYLKQKLTEDMKKPPPKTSRN